MMDCIYKQENNFKINYKKVLTCFWFLNHKTLRVCLDVEKLEGKKKFWKVVFVFSVFGLRKVKRKKKIERKVVRQTWVVMKRKISSQIWEETEEKIYF